jgi:hypothetical protein
VPSKPRLAGRSVTPRLRDEPLSLEIRRNRI